MARRTGSCRGLTLLLLSLPALAADDLSGGSGPYRRLFLDALLVESQSGVERVFHRPQKYASNPIITADMPWERGGSGPYLYGTVLRDQGKLRMWYHFIRGGYRNAYAESDDGIHWRKPALSIIEYEGSRENNLFVTVAQDPAEQPPRKERGQCHNPSVVPAPDGRYALFCYGADYDKVRVAFSEDGLHWKFVPETAERGLFESSDVVNFFYDPYKERYAATWKGPTRRGRSAGIAFSADALHWTKPSNTPVFTADDLDPPDTQIYGMPVFAYQGLYIGLPWIYHARIHYAPEMLMTRAEAESAGPLTMDVQLAWSWDLLNWTRPPTREAFLPNGAEGTFDSKMITTARAPVVVGDLLYFYYGGFDNVHNARNFNGAIGLATMRLDGFCSMRARAQGWLTTRREKLSSPAILINATTASGGSLTAELLDRSGNVIPGFSRNDCEPFRGDSVRHELRWKGGSMPDVVKIRFYLDRAELWSYWPAR